MDVARSDQIDDRSRQEWTRVAPAWRKWSRQYAIQTRAATDVIIKSARVRRGMWVIDIASGTGEPSLTLADQVGPEGHVVATDFTPEMLKVAADRAKASGTNNITFQHASAQHLPFDSASFDAVTCRFGLGYVSDLASALKEARRVLRPGGRAAFVAWGPPAQNPLFTTTIGVLMKYAVVRPPDPASPSPFRFGYVGVNHGESGTISRALMDAGFNGVMERCLTVQWPWPGRVEEAWQYFREASPFHWMVDRLTEEDQTRAVAEVLAAMAQYYNGRQVFFPTVILVATGDR